jgi:hypothetical protein
MRAKHTLSERESHAVRFAWWASFFATIALIAILGLARSAQAAETPLSGALSTAPSAPSHEAEDEFEEGEEEELEACEEAEEAGEECEPRSRSAEEVPDACMLQSAEATAALLPAHDQVQVTLRYTALAPAVVSIRYSLRGGKGAVKMGSASHRFSRKGVFRETEKLSEAEMAKARAATEFDVRLDVVNSPQYCRGLFDSRLTARHSSHGRSSWTDPKAGRPGVEAG